MINDTIHLILIDAHTHLVETKRVNEFIEMQLLRKLNIFTFFIYKFGYYDEKRNDIYYIELWKDITLVISAFYHFKAFVNYLRKKLDFLNYVINVV